MDTLELSKSDAIDWLEEAARGIITEHADDWTPEEVADSIEDIIDDVAAVARWNCKKIIIEDCQMAINGYTIREA